MCVCVCIQKKMKLKNLQKFCSNFIFYGIQAEQVSKTITIFFYFAAGQKRATSSIREQPGQYRLTNGSERLTHTHKTQQISKENGAQKMAQREKTSEAPNVAGIIFDVSHSILFVAAIYTNEFNAIAGIRIN